jgi:Fe-Mn family superoxide dismutase
MRDALIRDFGSISAWAAEFSAMGKAQRGGSGWVLLTWRRATAGSSISGQWITRRRWPGPSRSSRSICTSTPITSTMAPRAAAYVDAFMAAINWPSVGAAYASLTPVG